MCGQGKCNFWCFFVHRFCWYFAILVWCNVGDPSRKRNIIFKSYWVALRPAVLSGARIWPSVSRCLEISFGLRGPSPRLLLPSGRLGLSPGVWGAPNKGNADGAVGIFRKCRARVGYGPAPGPTEKSLVSHFPVRWGVQQIPQSRSVWHGSGRVYLGSWRFTNTSVQISLRSVYESD